MSDEYRPGSRLWLVAVPLALVAVLALAPFLLFRPEKFRQPLTDKLSGVFGHPVLIGKISGGYFPPNLNLENVSLVRNGDTRYAAVDRARLPLGWAVLFSPKKWTPSQVDLQGLKVYVRRLPDGRWDAADWWPADQQGLAGDTSIRVTVKNSEIRLIDDALSTPAELVIAGVNGSRNAKGEVQLSGDLSGAALPASVSFQGNGSGNGELRWTEAGRTASFALEHQAGRFQATGGAVEWRLDHAAALARFYFRIKPAETSAAGSSYLRNWKLTGLVAGSTAVWTHTADIDGGNTEARWERQGANAAALNGAVKNVPVSSLKPVLGIWSEGLEGRLTGIVSDFRVAGSSGAVAEAQGRFSLDVENGFYRFPAGSVRALQKVKTLQYLRKKFPEFEEKGLPFTRLRLSGEIMKAGAQMQGSLAAGAVRTGVAGSLNFVAKSLDLWLQVQIRESLPHLLKELPDRYVAGEEGERRVLPIYGHLVGPWSDWRLRAYARSKVPASAQRRLRDASR